jgi:hypothetical protein
MDLSATPILRDLHPEGIEAAIASAIFEVSVTPIPTLTYSADLSISAHYLSRDVPIRFNHIGECDVRVMRQ